jgi:hypothetical protein
MGNNGKLNTSVWSITDNNDYADDDGDDDDGDHVEIYLK